MSEGKGIDVRCPRCFSRMIYYRARKQEFQCRFCGNVFKVPAVWPRGARSELVQEGGEARVQGEGPPR
ncbi:MAG: hypothetical protein QXU64_05190 [Thermofilaceae archaeon]